MKASRYPLRLSLYAERARLRREEPGNVAEQNIKLTLNSVSGKAAQSVGGSEDDPPRTACPWYAAATTAGTRRRVMEAALQNPHAIVQFSTDGVVSLETLDLDIGEELGQWEHKEIKEGIYLHSGVYSYLCVEDGKDITKTRGMNPDYSNEYSEEHEPEVMTVELEGKKDATMRDLLLQSSCGVAGAKRS